MLGSGRDSHGRTRIRVNILVEFRIVNGDMYDSDVTVHRWWRIIVGRGVIFINV